MRLKLSYTMMTGRFERRVDGEAELDTRKNWVTVSGGGMMPV